jgi:hypothetical protein
MQLREDARNTPRTPDDCHLEHKFGIEAQATICRGKAPCIMRSLIRPDCELRANHPKLLQSLVAKLAMCPFQQSYEL